MPTDLDIWVTHNLSLHCFFFFKFVILSPYPTHQKQSTTRPTHSLHTKSCKVDATKRRKVAATKSCKVAATGSCKVAATKSCKVAATKSCKVAATKSSKTNLHMKSSQAATMLQLAAATKPHHCCLFAAVHCEKIFISIRVIWTMKERKKLFMWRFNNKFGNILQKVRSDLKKNPNGRLLEAGILPRIVEKLPVLAPIKSGVGVYYSMGF